MSAATDARGLRAALAATWPAASSRRLGPWTIRQGGGDPLASAAFADCVPDHADIAAMEAAQAALGQRPAVLVGDDEGGLDARLAEAGYHRGASLLAFAAPVTPLAVAPPRPERAILHWPPLAITGEIWAEGGLESSGAAPMDRVAGIRTVLLARAGDLPAGAAFAGVAGETVVVHRIAVRERLRRQGVATTILRSAALWAQDLGVARFSLAVDERNLAARGLAASLGMDVVGQFHYRIK